MSRRGHMRVTVAYVWVILPPVGLGFGAVLYPAHIGCGSRFCYVGDCSASFRVL